MSYLDTLYVNGHNVRTLAGVSIVGQIQHWAPGDQRGEDDVIPGRPGAIGAVLPRAPFLITVPIRVQGASRGQRNDHLLNAMALLTGKTNIVPLRRRIATGSGNGYREHYAIGRFNGGAALTLLNDTTGRTELQVYNNSGAWWTGSKWIIP